MDFDYVEPSTIGTTGTNGTTGTRAVGGCEAKWNGAPVLSIAKRSRRAAIERFGLQSGVEPGTLNFEPIRRVKSLDLGYRHFVL